MTEKELHTGHRKRVKEKFMKLPPRVLEDYEVLEMLLFYVIPRADTKPLAKQLIEHYGSLQDVILGDPLKLKNITGFSDSLMIFFKLLEETYARLHLPLNEEQHILNNWGAVLKYCQLTMSHKSHEIFRILHLNKKNILIADELSQQGTLDNVAVYPREVIKRCIINNTAAIVMVHNHPSGDVSPSKGDIEITKQIKAALRSISVELHDHIIVAKDKYFSFRAQGILN